MPAIHHLAGRRKNDGIREIGIMDQLHVFRRLSPSQTRALAATRLIRFSNGLERYAFSRQASRQFAEAIDVPRKKSTLGPTKIVLLSHSERAGIVQASRVQGAMLC